MKAKINLIDKSHKAKIEFVVIVNNKSDLEDLVDFFTDRFSVVSEVVQ